jgi:hypothetical protein
MRGHRRGLGQEVNAPLLARCEKTPILEGYGLQPVREWLQTSPALAAEGTFSPLSDFFCSLQIPHERGALRALEKLTFCIRLQFDPCQAPCQPRTTSPQRASVRGSGFSNPRKRFIYDRAFSPGEERPELPNQLRLLLARALMLCIRARLQPGRKSHSYEGFSCGYRGKNRCLSPRYPLSP